MSILARWSHFGNNIVAFYVAGSTGILILYIKEVSLFQTRDVLTWKSTVLVCSVDYVTNLPYNICTLYCSLSIGTAGSLGASTMTSASSYTDSRAGRRKLKKRGEVSTLLVSATKFEVPWLINSAMHATLVENSVSGNWNGPRNEAFYSTFSPFQFTSFFSLISIQD